MKFPQIHSDPSDLHAQKELNQAFEVFDSEIYPDDESIMCSIHDSFNKENGNSHNCIGCNLADFTQLLHSSLQNVLVSTSIEAFSNVILYSYLLVERFEEIFKIMQLPESYRARHFRAFGKIRRWSNFLKHPKAFMLVHHPEYYFENEVEIEPNDKKKYTFINQEFIDKYYSGGKNNSKLYKELTNNKNVIVLLPLLDRLMVDFCAEQKKFIEIISSNEVFKEILDENSTIKEFYEDSDE